MELSRNDANKGEAEGEMVDAGVAFTRVPEYREESWVGTETKLEGRAIGRTDV